MTPPLLAAKGAQTALERANAVKGDIYTRKWETVRGKGKKRAVVHHEMHVNPGSLLVGLAAGVAAAGAAVLGGALALRFSGKQLKAGGNKYHYYMVDEFDSSSKTVTIVDKPAVAAVPARTETVPEQRIWREGSWIKGVWQEGHWDIVPGYTIDIPATPGVPAVTHTETTVTPSVSSLLTKHGIPKRYYTGADGTLLALQMESKQYPKMVLSSNEYIRETRVMSTNPLTRKREGCRRVYYKFKVPGIEIEDKPSTDNWWNPFD